MSWMPIQDHGPRMLSVRPFPNVKLVPTTNSMDSCGTRLERVVSTMDIQVLPSMSRTLRTMTSSTSGKILDIISPFKFQLGLYRNIIFIKFTGPTPPKDAIRLDT